MENPVYIISVVILWLLWFLVYKIKKINKQEELNKQRNFLIENAKKAKSATFVCPKCSKKSAVMDLTCNNCEKKTLQLYLPVPDTKYIQLDITGLLKCNTCFSEKITTCPSCRCIIDKSFIVTE